LRCAPPFLRRIISKFPTFEAYRPANMNNMAEFDEAVRRRAGKFNYIITVPIGTVF
jgi:hypothetical protein